MDKYDLIYLCESLQEDLNRQAMLDKKQPNHKVEFISKIKPDDYFLPKMHIGTSATVSDKVRNALFVEIHVDGKCIFRESYIPNESENLKIVEGMLVSRIMKNIFNYGVMSSKRLIDTLKPSL